MKIIYDIDEVPDFGCLSDGKVIELKLYYQNDEDEEEFYFKFGCYIDWYCCGIISLGGFEIGSFNSNFTSFQEKKLVKLAFDKLIENFVKKDEQFKLMFTTIDGDEGAELVESVVSKHPKFKLVSTFKNLNSGNINKMYINR